MIAIILSVLIISMIVASITLGIYFGVKKDTPDDTTSPRVSITYNPSGPYTTGDGVSIIATFTKDIKDIPHPQLVITGEEILTGVSMVKTSSTEYYYDLTITGTSSGTANVFVTDFEDLTGNTGVSVPQSGGTFELDVLTPNVSITYNPVGPYRETDQVTITANFNEIIKDIPHPQLVITGEETLTGVSMVKTNETQYYYDLTITGTSSGTANVFVTDFEDLAGNPGVSVPTFGKTFTLDNQAPGVSITYNPAGPYATGDGVSIIATFTKDIKDIPHPQLVITGEETLSGVSMVKTSATEYYYGLSITSTGSGTANVFVTDFEDLIGNPGVSVPTSGGTFDISNIVPEVSEITYASNYAPPFGFGARAYVYANFNTSIKSDPAPQLVLTGEETLSGVSMTMVGSNDTRYYARFNINSTGNGGVSVFITDYEDLSGNGGSSIPLAGGNFEINNTVNWVAGGNNSYDPGNIMYSKDGIKWQNTNEYGSCFATYCHGVGYGVSSDGTTAIWTAIGTGTKGNDNIKYSYDGITWTSSIGASFYDSILDSNFGVDYGASSDGVTPLWIATGSNDGSGREILYSLDGVSWEYTSGATGYSYTTGAAYGTSTDGTTPMWLVGGVTGNAQGAIRRSYDGVNWEPPSASGDYFLGNRACNGIAFGLSTDRTTPMWVAAGVQTTSDYNKAVIYSYDGIDWTKSQGASFTNTFSPGHAVAFGLSTDGQSPMWVAGGYNSSSSVPDVYNLIYSNDGITWHPTETQGASFITEGWGIHYGTSLDGVTPMWVAAGSDSTNDKGHLMYSYNGKYWFESDGSANTFTSRAYSVTDKTINPAWTILGLSVPWVN